MFADVNGACIIAGSMLIFIVHVLAWQTALRWYDTSGAAPGSRAYYVLLVILSNIMLTGNEAVL